MRKQLPAITSIRASRRFVNTCKRERAKRPTAARSAAIAGSMLVAGAAAAAAQLAWLAVLVAAHID
jgi:hypothetical protein